MFPSLGETLTNLCARRPAGWLGRRLYRHASGHQSGFEQALKRVPVGAGDHVLDVGCGGGAFLARVLTSGARAAGVDHSPQMLATSREQNAAAIEAGRLELRQADAAALPFPDGAFSHVFCLNAFFFFPDPAAAMDEMARVLKPGGWLSIITMPPEVERRMRWIFGPIARRMRFDAPEQISAWATAAELWTDAIARSPGGGYLHVSRRLLQADTTIEMPGFRGRILGNLGHLPVVEGEIWGAMPAHPAAEGEFVYVLEGALEIEIGGSRRELRSGDFAFVPANVLHSAEPREPAKVLLFGL